MGMTVTWRPTDRTVLAWAWVSVVANSVIIVTGGLVRLTGSGLGCPVWPRCTEESFVPHSALGWHGAIEFGNRMLTYVLVAVAVATAVVVWRWAATTAFAKALVLVLGLGIPFQAVIGGITVLTDLNPWVVAFHMLLSMALVIGSTILVVHVRGDRESLDPSQRKLLYAAFAVLLLAIYIGTIVTGSGPHAGDADAPRNGLDPQLWSRIHAASVWAFLVTLVATLVKVRGTGTFRRLRPVVIVTLIQGAIGYIQYFNDLPILLVATHLGVSAVLLTTITLAVSPTLSRLTRSEPAVI